VTLIFGRREYSITTMARWHDGTMARWHDGTMAQWHNGTMAQWHNGTVGMKLDSGCSSNVDGGNEMRTRMCVCKTEIVIHCTAVVVLQYSAKGIGE
jgi:hypothetical protein